MKHVINEKSGIITTITVAHRKAPERANHDDSLGLRSDKTVDEALLQAAYRDVLCAYVACKDLKYKLKSLIKKFGLQSEDLEDDS